MATCVSYTGEFQLVFKSPFAQVHKPCFYDGPIGIYYPDRNSIHSEDSPSFMSPENLVKTGFQKGSSVYCQTPLLIAK